MFQSLILESCSYATKKHKKLKYILLILSFLCFLTSVFSS